MKLRPYQQEAINYLLPRERAFIVAPAGSGKTIIAAAALKQAMQPGSPSPISEQAYIIWLANTREQVQQAEAAAASFGITIHAHCVAAQPDCSMAHVVIVDEAHHCPARIWSATIATATGIVWGFSATPWSTERVRFQLLTYFENFHTVSRSEVLAGGNLTEGRVFVHDVDLPGQFDSQIAAWTATETARRCRRFPFITREEHERRARWQATAECIRDNIARNDRIVSLANNENGSVLILVGTVEHGEALSARIFDSQIVHAKLGKVARKSRIDSFRDGTLRCLIATSLADEGLDVPRASVLILAAGGRSAAKLEQRAGRVMRPHDSKTFGTIHDFSDQGTSLGHSQYVARVRTYRKLGYSINRNTRALPARSVPALLAEERDTTLEFDVPLRAQTAGR